MDAKRLAMILAILVLLPVFVGLFVDAVYTEPKYDQFCNSTQYSYPQKVATNCTAPSYDARVDQCYRDSGNPVYDYDANGCQTTFNSCDYCNKYFNEATSKYNRNVFFIILPVGLAIVLIGIFLSIEYIGAGLMFAGLITMFYATIRYFSELSKLARALIILAELLLIMWIGYRKIGEHRDKPLFGSKPSKGKKRKR